MYIPLKGKTRELVPIETIMRILKVLNGIFLEEHVLLWEISTHQIILS
jgi:hypothetical protein